VALKVLPLLPINEVQGRDREVEAEDDTDVDRIKDLAEFESKDR
jgi:hypothetical protein